ncbi:MAG: ABC transporter ATP-binding protein [Clostridia bacterium]|nr:ABC transporter ATP-binding protein [Clostridia bacterium]
MLPLDNLSEAAVKALQERGLSPDDVSVALKLDLDIEGEFGESWLLYTAKTDTLIRLLADTASIPKIQSANKSKDFKDFDKKPDALKVAFLDETDLHCYSDMVVDTLASSNRLIMRKHPTPRPDTAGMSEEETDKILAKWDEDSDFEIFGFSTNSKRQYLFAFRDIVGRLRKGEEVADDDPIFNQFYARCPKCGKIYENQYRKLCTDCDALDTKAILKRIFAYVLPYKKFVLQLLFCMVMVTAISLITPIINGRILYDDVLNTNGKWHSLPMLFTVLGVSVGIGFVSLFFTIWNNRLSLRLTHRITRDVKQSIFKSMLPLSLGFFNSKSTGWLNNRLIGDSNLIYNFLAYIPYVAIQIVTLIGIAIFLFQLNFVLTLIVFIPVPIIIFIYRVVLPKMNVLHTKLNRASSGLNSVISDAMVGIRVVKAFAKEAEETNRFHQRSEIHYDANLKVNMMSLTIFPVINLLIGMSSQAIWGIGGLSVMGETMTYGEWSTYFGYVGMLFGPLQALNQFVSLTLSTLNGAQRIFEITDMVPEIRDAEKPVEIQQFKGDISFDNVNFHYLPNRPILKNVTINIKAGDNIGLVGHTGSGKSTIANLITRMYDPVSGSISIDGVNLKDIKLDDIRRNVAIVSQEVFIFRGTIADNIRYAKPDATMTDVIAAAKAANAHDFIMRLPEGYETQVGTGNRSLSGGERQRVSIARALLMSPSILILDEATAAMDTETERLIGDALAKLIEGRTCISIAHRLSTLKDCNYLFAIENGEIAEEGTPEELLAKKGVYYKLYMLQSDAMKKVLSGT